jgi:succinoglycan biosynthesis transport protein ExoP
MSPTVTGGRIIGFTSSVPGEGKSTTCAAVARWVASTGAKTLLVDCDLRNPTLSRSLAPRTAAGLLQVVNGQSTLENAIWSDNATGMKFLPAASMSTARLAHSSEILASAQTRKLLDSLRNDYDYIFVDFSPLMPIVDVRVSTNLVDSYIFVVAWGDTRIEFVKQALNSAKGVYEHLLGVVLNKVNLAAIDRYDGGGGYYTHGSYARYGYSE